MRVAPIVLALVCVTFSQSALAIVSPDDPRFTGDNRQSMAADSVFPTASVETGSPVTPVVPVAVPDEVEKQPQAASPPSSP